MPTPPSAQCSIWCPSTNRVLVQPRKRQPPSLARNARRIGGGMDRDRRPMDNGSPFSSSLMPTTEQSQAMRRDVTAVTWGPCSIWAWSMSRARRAPTASWEMSRAGRAPTGTCTTTRVLLEQREVFAATLVGLVHRAHNVAWNRAWHASLMTYTNVPLLDGSATIGFNPSNGALY